MNGWNVLAEEIPQKYLSELSDKAPSMPLAMFRFALSRFMEGYENERPATVRDELDRLADASAHLTVMLGELSLTASDKLAISEHRHGRAGLSDRLRADLRDLMGMAEMARRDAEQGVSTGRTLSANTRLVADLARGLRVGGGQVDDRPQGELVQAFGIALSIAGKSVGHPAKSVTSALKTIERVRKE